MSLPPTARHIRFVLVRPSHPGNIGAAARAIRTMGYGRLVLVSPHKYPHADANAMAAGADDVLRDLRVVSDLADAVGDCRLVLGATARVRGVRLAEHTPAAAAARAEQTALDGGEVALLFGNERTGLENEELHRCHGAVHIPSDPAFGSLNLAQAVILLAYEWSKQAELEQPTIEELLPPAPQDELEGMIAQFEALLEPTGYFRPPSRAAATRRTLRNMLTKPGWNHLEVRTMRGVLSSLGKGPRKP